jgi:hypothetical protein
LIDADSAGSDVSDMKLRTFVERYGQPFSEMLGIDIRSCRKEEISKWFLASILYSKPIRESSATNTYRVFEEEGVVSPSKIIETGWDGLVSLLDEGGYTRYDFSTATKLLGVFGNLQKQFGGDLNLLHNAAGDSDDLQKRLMNLGKGIGPTTVSIFLREMRDAWRKADPEPSPLVKLAMKELGVKDLKRLARKKHLNVVRLETALLRLGKDFVRRGKRIDVELD